MEPTSDHTRSEKLWVALALIVALLAIVVRVHNAFTYPPLRGFDAPGHATNIAALLDGRIYHPRSWSGFHPPLAYGVGAALWRLLPESIPVHVTLRIFSAACGVGAVWIIWSVLRRFTRPADAAVVAAFGLCVPAFTIASGMIGNEMMSMLLITAVLARITMASAPARPALHALGSGALLGASILTKATGLVALGAAGLFYLVRLRSDPRRMLVVVAVLLASVVAISGPWYAHRVSESGGSILSVVSGGVGSPDARLAMEDQPPGRREIGHYLSFPVAAFLAPVYSLMLESVPGLLYAATWADPHGDFMVSGTPNVIYAMVVSTLLGVLPTGLLLYGTFLVLRSPREHRAWVGPAAFGAAIVLAFLRYSWVFPSYAAVKATYLLPAMLPASYAVVVALDRFGARTRSALRGALLAIGTVVAAITWWGWWW